MTYEYVIQKVKKAYESLIECVQSALEEEDTELATICASGLAHMANAEGANYVYEPPYYNHAMRLVKSVVNYAKREGVPSWLQDDIKEMKKILKEAGWE